MLKSNNMSYFCKFCAKSYKSETTYKNHLHFCEFQHKSVHDTYDSNYMPNTELMFEFMQHMMVKIKSLEDDNAILKRHLNYKINRINVVQWLNQNLKMSISLDNWINDLPYKSIMNTVFDTNIYTGLIDLIDNHLDSCPLKTVISKKNHFYLYDDNQWNICDFDKIHKVIKKIYLKVMHCFLNDPEYIALCESENDDLQEDYLFKYNKILGPSNENWVKQVRKNWFEKSIIDINR